MELAYRFIIYILIANVGYMIFSLYRKGFRHYSGYISQLFFLLCLMIVMVARDVSGGMALGVSFAGISILVLLPIFLQRQIDGLMAENRITEIEPYARWKANLAWSELNVHMHDVARLAEEFGDDNNRLETELRALLNRGEPYDSMTRIFLGLIHFNNRNFENLIRDLRQEGREFSDHSFEELLYLVRAYLETTRYDEAVAAQMALEAKLNEGEESSPEKRANLVISRMIFLAFMGWLNDFDRLIQSGEAGIERLPSVLCSFWRGVCLFNSGEYTEGEKAMSEVMKSFTDDEAGDAMLPFMRKRFFALIENREFFDNKIRPHLQALYAKSGQAMIELIGNESALAEKSEFSERASSILGWATMVVSATLMMKLNVEDVVSLIEVGANSSFLVKNGEYFRLLTYQFIHIGWMHLLMNLVALKFFGPPVETVAGWPLFLGIYFLCGTAGGAAAVYAGQPLSAGASAAVLGLLSVALVFELMKVKGSEALTRRHNFSTLVFILVINLVIGAVETVVDNSAHLGGLIAGAVIGFMLVPVINSRFLKPVAGFVSVWLCIFALLISLYQMNLQRQNGFYPANPGAFHDLKPGTGSMSLETPESWKIEKIEEEPGQFGAEFVGPFKERLAVLIAANEEPSEKVLLEYVNQRTNEIEKSSEISLKSRKGPEKIGTNEKTIFRIRWQLSAAGGPLSVVDYLVFEKNLLYLLRFFLGTENDGAYDRIMNRTVESFRLK
ncbi:MAG: rhomboid family intramembrane serine protease [Candidatus Riflebacteria bacterium]|nr:rhomboid family intramembrane serine protease [Candidatus Riflebacteria bacterium]